MKMKAKKGKKLCSDYLSIRKKLYRFILLLKENLIVSSLIYFANGVNSDASIFFVVL